MFKPLIFYIGLRYTRAKRRTQFISFITLTSVMGIALGVTALITVLSVMNGFEAELRERILGMTSHATLTGKYGQLENWPEARSHQKHAPCTRHSPVYYGASDDQCRPPRKWNDAQWHHARLRTQGFGSG